MGKERQGSLWVNNQKLVTKLKTNCTNCAILYQNCIDKHPSPIKAAIVTTINATVAGAAMSLVMDNVFFYIRSTFSVSPPRLVSLNHSNQLAKSISQKRMVMACTRGALMGIDAGITCVMKRIRDKEDVQTSMIAGIGAGVLVSLLRGTGLTNAIAFGVAHGVINGGITTVKEKLSWPPRTEDALFRKTSDMLSNLGLGHYEENFKKEFLTDETLPLLSDSTLKEAKIPVGARLLIIDHIQKEEKAKKRC